MWDRSDEDRMALALSGMKVPLVIRSPPGSSGTNRGADLETAAPQGDERTSRIGGLTTMGPSRALDDVLGKVHSGRVRMTAVRCNGDSDKHYETVFDINVEEPIAIKSRPQNERIAPHRYS
jgi:hypothetical protein